MNRSQERLIHLLSGDFSNHAQALANPPLYAHILVRFRPLPQLPPGSLLLEQSYAIDPGSPYRIRVLRVEELDGGLVIRNQAIHSAERFWGAVDDEGKRGEILQSDLRLLEGCTYLVSEQDDGFVGEVEPGCRCLVERRGTTAYLVSRFELDPQGMSTVDKGHHPQTHERLWGSLAGPFCFERTSDLVTSLPEVWQDPLRQEAHP